MFLWARRPDHYQNGCSAQHAVQSRDRLRWFLSVARARPSVRWMVVLCGAMGKSEQSDDLGAVSRVPLQGLTWPSERARGICIFRFSLAFAVV